jgi:hypothetical protein
MGARDALVHHDRAGRRPAARIGGGDDPGSTNGWQTILSFLRPSRGFAMPRARQTATMQAAAYDRIDDSLSGRRRSAGTGAALRHMFTGQPEPCDMDRQR